MQSTVGGLSIDSESEGPEGSLANWKCLTRSRLIPTKGWKREATDRSHVQQRGSTILVIRVLYVPDCP